MQHQNAPEEKLKDMSAEIVRLKVTNPNLSSRQIGKIVNRDHSNVVKCLKKYGIDNKRVETYKLYRAEILAGIQEKIAESIMNDEESLKHASLLQKITGLGILHDKERLQRGQSTHNISMAKVVEMVDKELSDKQSKIDEKTTKN